MKNYAKKYLSLFVAVLMAVTMLIPTAVFAAVKDEDMEVSENMVMTPGESETLSVTLDSWKGATTDDYAVEDTIWSVTDNSNILTHSAVNKGSGFAVTVKNNAAAASTAKVVATLAPKSGATAGAVTLTKTFNITVNTNTTALDDFQFDTKVDNPLVLTGNQTVAVTSTDVDFDEVKGNITFASSDSNVVEAAQSDNKAQVTLTPKKGGKATITATYHAGANTKTATLTVYASTSVSPLVSTATINGSKESTIDISAIKGTAVLTVVTKDAAGNEIPADIASKVLTGDENTGLLTSADPSVVKILSDEEAAKLGTNTEKAKGTYTIQALKHGETTVNVSGGTGVTVASAKVTVAAVNPIAKIYTKSKNEFSVDEAKDVKNNVSEVPLDTKDNNTVKIYAYVEGAENTLAPTDPTITWTSSNEDVVSVAAVSNADAKSTGINRYQSSAKITAKKYGQATITATANDGSKTKTSFTVTIYGFEFNNESMEVTKGAEFTAPYTTYGYAADDLIWETSDSSVATVDKAGKITVTGYGKATITVKNKQNVVLDTLVLNSNASNGVPVYRVYNPNSGEHFYTTSKTEKDGLVKLGWKDENIAWYGAKDSTTGIAIYRLYNPNAGEHVYTKDEAEKDNLVKAGWNYEKVEFYAAKTSNYPVFRNYNPNAFANNHNYSTSKDEYQNLINLGWNDEGVVFYAVNPGTNG